MESVDRTSESERRSSSWPHARSPVEERAAWLDRSCGGDARLRARVERLLELDRALPDTFLEGPVVPARLEPGSRFAGFRILGVLGEGGMGTVYSAQQTLPTREIALKVIRADRLTPAAHRRFEREVEALGSLQHPGIAQIHGAGTARRADGEVDEPYLAMELVRGKPILAFADAKDLGPSKRMDLVARVADAVHHAHSAESCIATSSRTTCWWRRRRRATERSRRGPRCWTSGSRGCSTTTPTRRGRASWWARSPT